MEGQVKVSHARYSFVLAENIVYSIILDSLVPRELQQGLDQLKKEFEDLKRDHELGLKRKAECEANNGRCINEVATLRKTLEVLLLLHIRCLSSSL